MAGMEIKSFGSPDEARSFEKGKADIVNLGEITLGRGEFQPGWRWSDHMQATAGTDSCQASHTGYVLSGRLRVKMDDGAEHEVGPADAFVIPPGHDAWVVGDEPCVLLDWTGMARYAKSS